MRARNTRITAAAGVLAAGAAAAGIFAVTASASPAVAGHAAAHRQGYPSYQVRQVVNGASLRHVNSRTGASEGLSQPGPIAQAGGDLYVAFGNGVGPQGQASASGNQDSTIVQLTPGGAVVARWDVAGQVAGLAADPDTGEIAATVNQAGHSSIYSIEAGGALVHYRYDKALPGSGGTAGAVFVKGQLVVTAAAPGAGPAAPQARYPAAYAVSLNQQTRVAAVTALYYETSAARLANAGPAGWLGRAVHLGLTGPLTDGVTAARTPRFGGWFVLNSPRDSVQVYTSPGGNLWEMQLAQPVADSAFATDWHGALYATDPGADAVDLIGNAPFWPGTQFVAVAPCAARHAAADCAAASLGRMNMFTGQIIPVELNGSVRPSRLVFLPAGQG